MILCLIFKINPMIFHPLKFLKNYLDGDFASNDYAVLWSGIISITKRKIKRLCKIKKWCGLGFPSGKCRSYKSLDVYLTSRVICRCGFPVIAQNFACSPNFFLRSLAAETIICPSLLPYSELAQTYGHHCSSVSRIGLISYNINMYYMVVMPEINDEVVQCGVYLQKDGSNVNDYGNYM